MRCFVVRTFLAILFASFHFVPLRLRIKTTAMRRRRRQRRGPNVRDVRLHRESSLYDNKEEKERGRGSFLEVRDGLPISRAMKNSSCCPVVFLWLNNGRNGRHCRRRRRERKAFHSIPGGHFFFFFFSSSSRPRRRPLPSLVILFCSFFFLFAFRRATHRTQFADNRMNE